MKMLSKRCLQLLMAASGICILAAPVQATTLAQKCELGETCMIPGNDGGTTYYLVTPKDGMTYTCDVKATNGKMIFWVGDEKDFKLESGGGPHTAAPSTTIKISGRFGHPNDQTSEGHITFNKLALTSEGEVTCQASD